MRAFLQRCEVRLSTMHRVATALLSGAGILVLLPSVERDAVTSVLRALLHGSVDANRVLLAASIALSIVLVVVLVWMVVRQLAQFYFHASHILRDGSETYAPRFTLTSLRLPLGELGTQAEARYDELRSSRHNLDLVVTANPRARRRIDRQLAAYPALSTDHERSDLERIDALLVLAAARRRELIDEVVKVEHGMARHVLRLQVVVLRYVKALLVVIATLLASFVTEASINGAMDVTTASQRWIAATMAIWAPTVVIVVASPVRWVESMLRAEGAPRSTVHNDPEFVHAENVARCIAAAAWVAAVVALARLTLAGDLSGQARAGTVVALAASLGLVIVATAQWSSRPWATRR